MLPIVEQYHVPRPDSRAKGSSQRMLVIPWRLGAPWMMEVLRG
jgi:hypothetical protein